MIAVVDSFVSERSKTLRKALFTAGFPCASLVPDELDAKCPVKLIITYPELFDELRHRPLDDIFIIVVGGGFINSALNAAAAEDYDDILTMARARLRKVFSLTDRNMFAFGVLSNRGVFYTKKHFEVYGNIVIPTVSEYMIFKFLISCAGEDKYIPSSTIRRFCYVRDLANAKNIDGNIAAHISNLNSKLLRAYGRHLIRMKRNCGYYFDLGNL